MIVVADINALWRRKPFESLSAKVAVLGLAPRDPLAAWRARAMRSPAATTCDGWQEVSVLMPPGWASRFPGFAAYRLQSVARRVAKQAGRSVAALVVTSPHYLPLVRRVGRGVPSFYYCSDDYSQYAGWGGTAMLRPEAELVREVAHSFFVSDALAERAVREYAVPPARFSVSPNATSPAFLEPVAAERIEELFARHPRLARPVVGVVGVVSERLDFELLLQCASERDVGSLVMVGPFARGVAVPAFRRLREHPRCVWVGPQPHAELACWMQALDVALIPYAETPLNYSCSPLRLFDHLAAGRPIVATAACRQIHQFTELVQVGGTREQVLAMVGLACRQPPAAELREKMRQAAAQNTWEVRAAGLAKRLTVVAAPPGP